MCPHDVRLLRGKLLVVQTLLTYYENIVLLIPITFQWIHYFCKYRNRSVSVRIPVTAQKILCWHQVHWSFTKQGAEASVGLPTQKSTRRRLYFFIIFPRTLISEVTRTVSPEHFTIMTEDTVQNCLVYGGNVSCLFRCRSRSRRDRGSRSEVNLPGDYLETSTVINYAKLSSQRRRVLLESVRSTTSPRGLQLNTLFAEELLLYCVCVERLAADET